MKMKTVQKRNLPRSLLLRKVKSTLNLMMTLKKNLVKKKSPKQQ